MKNYIVTLKSDRAYIEPGERGKVVKFSITARNMKEALKKALKQTDLDIVESHIEETEGHYE